MSDSPIEKAMRDPKLEAEIHRLREMYREIKEEFEALRRGAQHGVCQHCLGHRVCKRIPVMERIENPFSQQALQDFDSLTPPRYHDLSLCVKCEGIMLAEQAEWTAERYTRPMREPSPREIVLIEDILDAEEVSG